MERDNRFLNHAYLKNLFPIMFSVLGGTINALVDSVFVSHSIGSDAFAAVNVSMPIYLLLCTVGSLLAGGSSVLSAQCTGEDQLKKAESHFKELICMCIIVGGAITILGVVFCRPLSYALCQGGQLTGHVYKYSLVTFSGSIFTMGLYIPTNYLQLEGKNHHISIMFGILVTVDILLDLILMVVIPLGLYGAALASVISTAAACVYGFAALEKGYTNYHFGVKLPGEIRSLLRLGSPIALSNLYDTIKLLALNWIILNYYGENMSAVWAAVNTLCELSLIVISGVPRAAFPMTAAFSSSRENSGIRILIKLQARAGIAISAAFALILTVSCIPVRKMFGLEDSMLIPCLCVGISTVFYVICSIWDSYFNAVGMITISNILACARKLVFPILAATAIAAFSGSIWFFLPISGALTILAALIITYIYYRRSLNTRRPLSRYLLLDDILEREKKILDFSIKADMESVCCASEQIREFCEENNMNRKYTMRLGLSIEELLNVIISKSSDIQSVDLRAYALSGVAGLRIRCFGTNYDPFNDDSSDEDFLIGINMIRKMADVSEHTYTLGMNIINIIFPLE